MQLATDAERLCQALLRIDTTNPPGNERPAAELLERELRQVGLEPVIVEGAPQRSNLVVRYRGKGSLPPLLLTAHLDVVEADPTTWQRPPFSGEVHDGCLWGRGAIDMKNMAAMCSAIMLRLARERPQLSRDVIFAAVADEEAGCELGSRFLVEQHRHLVEAEFALGEGGGFTLHVGDSSFYPVQVAEKGMCWVRARLTGEAGHGSVPRPESAVIRLGEALASLRAPLPVHPSALVRDMIGAIAARQPAIMRPVLRLLGNQRVLSRLTRLAPGNSVARGFAALLSNTASPTVVRAGAKTNVIPGVAEFEIDGRLLPGQSVEDFLGELRAVLGPEVQLEVLRSEPAVETRPVASPVWSAIEDQLKVHAPESSVLPFLVPGFTDAKYFTQMGARWYGFAPVRIERGSGLDFAAMFHGKDERVPVAGLHWGATVLDAVVRQVAT